MNSEFNDLIESIAADGMVTSKERDVLYRAANRLGIDRETADVHLEATLHKVRHDQRSDRRHTTASRDTECGNCGAKLEAHSSRCVFCGSEQRYSTRTGGDFILALQEALEEQSRIDSQQPGWRSVLELDGGCAQARRQAAIIAAFDLPRDTKELLSLFLHCDANAEVEAEGVLVYAPEKIMKTAWRSKATMAYRQLELVESKDAGVIETLEKYRPRYGASSNDIEKTEKARHRKKRLGKRLVKGSIAAAIVLFFIIPAVSCVSMFIGAAKDMQGQRDAVIRDRGQVDDEVARLSALQEKIRSDIDSGNLASAQSSLPQLRYAIPKAVLEGDAEYQRRVERYDDMRMEYRELIAELESGDPPAAGPATHQE